MDCLLRLQAPLIYATLTAACHEQKGLLSIRRAQAPKKAALQCQQHAASHELPRLAAPLHRLCITCSRIQLGTSVQGRVDDGLWTSKELLDAFEDYNEACKASAEAVEACMKQLCKDLHVRHSAPLTCTYQAASPPACKSLMHSAACLVSPTRHGGPQDLATISFLPSRDSVFVADAAHPPHLEVSDESLCQHHVHVESPACCTAPPTLSNTSPPTVPQRYRKGVSAQACCPTLTRDLPHGRHLETQAKLYSWIHWPRMSPRQG